MTSVSTYGQFLRIQKETLRTQERLVDLQEQATTGKKGIVYGDLGTEARLSLSYRATSKQLERFRTNIDQVEARGAVTDTVLSRVNSLIGELRQEYDKLSGDLNVDTTFLNEIGRRGLAELEDLLNTQLDGRYLFSGNAISTKPVLNVETGLLTRYQTIVRETIEAPYSRDAATTGTNSALNAVSAALRDPARAYNPVPTYDHDNNTATAAIDLFTAPVAPEAVSPVFNGNIYFAGTPVRARVDTNFDAEYGIRADAAVFQDVLESFAIAASLTYPTDPGGTKGGGLTETPGESYRALLSRGQTLAIDSVSAVATEQGKLGVVRRQLEQTKTKHEDVLTTLTRDIGRVEDADLAEVFSRVQQTQVALQASFRITAGLQELSLLNYLR